MSEELLGLIEDFKKDDRLSFFDEARTKQALVLRVLKALGWDPFNIDEVCPEYSVGGKRVDYVLRHGGINKAFIEVKKVSENLERHQEQLLNYSFREGVKLAILTNGISWWFYLPLREGSWEQRKFYAIDIYDQKSEEIAKKFEEFLSKENVVSDRTIENAENLYKNRQKQYFIKETLPNRQLPHTVQFSKDHELNERQKRYFEFWSKLLEEFKKVKPYVKKQDAPEKSWFSLPTGHSGIHFEWYFKEKPIKGFTKGFYVALHFELKRYEDNEKLIEYFLSKKEEIEKKLMEDGLVFMKKWGREWAQIYIKRDSNNLDEENINWGKEKMVKFYDVFKPLLDEFFKKR